MSGKPWDGIADSILDTIKGRAKDFLEQNVAAKDMLTDRARALAQLVFEYKIATDAGVKAGILHEIEVVRQTIENELSALALNGKAESIAAFKEIVGTALGAVVKYLPAILSAI